MHDEHGYHEKQGMPYVDYFLPFFLENAPDLIAECRVNQNNQNDKKDNEQENQDQQQSQPQQQMSKENAEQLLNAVKQEEQNVRDKVQKQMQNASSRSLEKDW